jgi:hypothetical protein
MACEYIPEQKKTTHINLSFVIAENHLIQVDKSLHKSLAQQKKPYLWSASSGSKFLNFKPEFDFNNYHYVDLKQCAPLTQSRIFKGKFHPDQILVVEGQDNDELLDLMNKCMDATKSIVSFFSIKNRCFIHPTTNQLISMSYDYAERKEMCDIAFKKWSIDNFKFINQNMSHIAHNVLKICLNEKLPEQSLNNNALELFNNFYPRPIIHRRNEIDRPWAFVEMWDINKSYTQALWELVEENEVIPIPTCMDNIEPFNENDNIEIGFYFVEAFEIAKLSALPIPSQFVPHFWIERMLKAGYITKKQIKLKLGCLQFYEAKKFEHFIKEIYNTFPE